MSSVGQTFLVSLFVPSFIASFVLSEGGFGLLYSGATLGSAFLLPWIGRRMDRDHLHHFTLGVVGLLAGSAFLMASAWHVSVLAVALLGVRLGGQGLSSHTALTAMARYFEAGRGRALSISSLGFPLGESVLPLLLTLVIGWWGWRSAWVVLGAAVIAFGPMLVRLLLRSGLELHPVKAAAAARAREETEEAEARRHLPLTHTPAEVLKDTRFWLILPAVVLPAFWGTGFILYQTAIAATSGWSAPLMASAFVGLAVAVPAHCTPDGRGYRPARTARRLVGRLRVHGAARRDLRTQRCDRDGAVGRAVRHTPPRRNQEHANVGSRGEHGAQPALGRLRRRGGRAGRAAGGSRRDYGGRQPDGDAAVGGNACSLGRYGRPRQAVDSVRGASQQCVRAASTPHRP